GDTMEYGTQVQVLRKGVLFPPRANKLYELYKSHAALDEIDAETAEQVQRRYLKKRFGEVFAELRTSLPVEEIERAERDPKHKMALVFRWYFEHALGQALSGSSEGRVEDQCHHWSSAGTSNTRLGRRSVAPARAGWISRSTADPPWALSTSGSKGPSWRSGSVATWRTST